MWVSEAVPYFMQYSSIGTEENHNITQDGLSLDKGSILITTMWFQVNERIQKEVYILPNATKRKI
jgi:hypothetical protein